jgi:hypothetical protein
MGCSGARDGGHLDDTWRQVMSGGKFCSAASERSLTRARCRVKVARMIENIFAVMLHSTSTLGSAECRDRAPSGTMACRVSAEKQSLPNNVQLTNGPIRPALLPSKPISRTETGRVARSEYALNAAAPSSGCRHPILAGPCRYRFGQVRAIGGQAAFAVALSRCCGAQDCTHGAASQDFAV